MSVSLPDRFARLEQEMPGFLSAAVGHLDRPGELTVHTAGGLSLGEAEAELGAMVAGFAATYEALGGRIDLGSNDELLVSASKGYLLAKVDHRSRRYVAVLLSSSGNIGFLRFQLRGFLRALAT